jgi:(1->4)-alpha-D-glucan 1-alpha-D-glucosylmutase
LRADWPIEGTTGYDFLNQVAGLLVDARSEPVLTRAYQRFTRDARDFDEILYPAKRQIIRNRLSGELHVLARQLHRIARRHPRTRDYTLQGLTLALAEVVAAFPVYRTYADARGANQDDRRDIAWAVAQARKRWDRPGREVFDFIEAALTVDLAQVPGYGRRRVLRFAMKFQQYTSPVMAKGFEDTALYRYPRLLCLNDVGGDPRQFGLTVAAFHHTNQQRARQWPHAMLTTATHDTKRGEDVRARLAALTSVPIEWGREVRHWARLNRPWKLPVQERAAPGAADEYLLYQTLIGAWPIELMDGTWDDGVAAEFVARIQAYMTKALREAKLNSSWNDPNADYEDATTQFVARILDRETGRLFLDAFLPLQRRVAELGVHNSLVQLVLKLTCPGVPDIYQGCELWDLSLVDPDNRRPVDFAQRASLLEQVKTLDAMAPAERTSQLAAWRQHWQDGTIKLHVLRRLLALRAAHPELFAEGDYLPIELEGVATDNAIAFQRVHGEKRIVVAAILRAGQAASVAGGLGSALLTLAPGSVDVLGGDPSPPALPFEHLPVAVLLKE